MSARAAIITGASSGIGLAIAHVLGEEGHALTIAARRRGRLEQAAAELRDAGHEAEAVAANLVSEDDVQRVVQAREARFGRLNVPVNCAGMRVGAPVDEIQTKFTDRQLALNLRAPVRFYRECAGLLRAAGNASISGKSGRPWLSVYSATKAGVIGFTQAINKKLNGEDITSRRLRASSTRPMTEFARQQVAPEQMITTQDIAESVRFLLRLSPNCVVPEIVFQRAAESL